MYEIISTDLRNQFRNYVNECSPSCFLLSQGEITERERHLLINSTLTCTIWVNISLWQQI